MSNLTAYSPVWPPGLAGNLDVIWYESSRCAHGTELHTTTYYAYSGKAVPISRDCGQAIQNFNYFMGPTYSTPWDCTYSEHSKGWYRAKCYVHVKNIIEESIDFWKTPVNLTSSVSHF